MERRIIWKADKEVQAELWEEWRKTLASADKRIQEAVKKEIRKRWVKILKSCIRNTIIGDILFGIKRTFSGKPARFYANALEAGGFK